MMINVDDKNQDKMQERYCNFISFMMFSIYASNVLFIVKLSFGVDTERVSVLLKLCLVLYFLNIFIKSPKISIRFFFLTGLIVLVWIIDYLMFPQLNDVAIDYAVKFCFFCFLSMFVIVKVSNFAVLLRTLVIVAEYIVAISFIVVVLSVVGIVPISSQDYYMGLGYSLLFPVLLLMYNCVVSITFKKIMFVIIGIVAILFLGSRGPLLSIACYFCYLVLNVLSSKRGQYSAKIKKLCSIVITLLILFVLFFDTIIKLLHRILESYNVYSRSLNALVSGIIDDSNRSIIYEKLRNGIFSDPITIKGIGAEKLLLDGIYAHNIFYEIVYQFGILVGGMLSIGLIVLMFKTLFRLSGDEARKSFIRIVFFVAFPKLLLSDTFWCEYSFWMWLVLLLVNGRWVYSGGRHSIDTRPDKIKEGYES